MRVEAHRRGLADRAGVRRLQFEVRRKIAARAHLTACEACGAAAEKDVQLNSSAEPPKKAAQTDTQKSVFRGDDSRWAVPLFGVGDLRKKLNVELVPVTDVTPPVSILY